MPSVPLHQRRSSPPLGRDLRTTRKLATLTQSELAARAGCSLPTLRAAERGEGALKTFMSLAAVLDMQIGARSLPLGTTLGARLATLRGRREMGQRVVAQLAGISPTTLAALERNSGGHLATVIRVGEALGAQLRLVPAGSAIPFWTGPASSSVHQAWTTPSALLERLYVVVDGAFGLDPCSPVRRGPQAPVKAKLRYVEADDALSLPWKAATVFMNPPYGRQLRLWVAKAHAEAASGRAGTVFGLLPARPDTGWWHEHVAGQADVWLLRGRLSFGTGANAAPFPSAIVVWSARPEHIDRMAVAFPGAWHVPLAERRQQAEPGLAAE